MSISDFLFRYYCVLYKRAWTAAQNQIAAEMYCILKVCRLKKKPILGAWIGIAKLNVNVSIRDERSGVESYPYPVKAS